MLMNSVPATNSDQYHPGGVFSPDLVSINSDIFASNPATFNHNISTLSQQPTMNFFQDSHTRGSSVEAPPRYHNVQVPNLAALIDHAITAPVEPTDCSHQLADAIKESLSYQNSLSWLQANYPMQIQGEWGFSSPLNDLNHTVHCVESQAAGGDAAAKLGFSENLQEPFDWLSLIGYNASDQASRSLADSNQSGEFQRRNSNSIGIDSFALVAQSTKPLETAALFDPSKLTTLANNALTERHDVNNTLSFNPFENWQHDFPKHENVYEGNDVDDKIATPLRLSSSSSNSSSQFSSPSLSSSSSSNDRSCTFSPFHPSVDLNDLDENYSISEAFANSVSQDVENQHMYQQSSLEEFLNTGKYTNSSQPMTTGNLPNYENHYPLQCPTDQQRSAEQAQLQQFWPPVFHQQIENIPLSDTRQSPSGIPAYLQKPTFICPKCGKGHTRQSNLLAHLRDTHSDVKKVFCDVPGCTKSYKRISECRRHKKDLHGIPLPSELNGKLRKSRSTLSSIKPSKCKHLAQR